MTTSNSEPEPRSVDRAILFAIICVTVGLSYLTIRCSMSIESFRQVYADMLGGKPLPRITTFLIGYHYAFVGLSWIIPIAAVAMMFIRSLTFAFYAVGVLGLLNILLIAFVYHGLVAPIISVFSNLSGN